MSNKNDQIILSVPKEIVLNAARAVPEPRPTDPKWYVPFTTTRLNDLLLAGSWQHRGIAETDELRKQVIPYAVVTSMGKVLTYWRGIDSAELRLRGKRSLGFGGHIEVIDSGLAGYARDTVAAFYAGLQRELQEELTFHSPPHSRVCGLLSDDTDPVGRVHVGVVVTVKASGAQTASAEAQLTSWLTREEALLQLDDFEGWSRVLIESDEFWSNIPKRPETKKSCVQFRNSNTTAYYSPARDVAYLGLALLRGMVPACDPLESVSIAGDMCVRFQERSGLTMEEFAAQHTEFITRLDAFFCKIIFTPADSSVQQMLWGAGQGLSVVVLEYALANLGCTYLSTVLSGIKDISQLGERTDFVSLLREVYPAAMLAFGNKPPYETSVGNLRGAIENARQHGVSFEDIGRIVEAYRLGFM